MHLYQVVALLPFILATSAERVWIPQIILQKFVER
jgi:hypothetical protein